MDGEVQLFFRRCLCSFASISLIPDGLPPSVNSLQPFLRLLLTVRQSLNCPSCLVLSRAEDTRLKPEPSPATVQQTPRNSFPWARTSAAPSNAS